MTPVNGSDATVNTPVEDLDFDVDSSAAYQQLRRALEDDAARAQADGRDDSARHPRGRWPDDPSSAQG